MKARIVRIVVDAFERGDDRARRRGIAEGLLVPMAHDLMRERGVQSRRSGRRTRQRCRGPSSSTSRSRGSRRICACGRDSCVSGRTTRSRSASGGGSASRSTSRSLSGSRSGRCSTLLASALPVQLPRGTQQAVAIAPILAAHVPGRSGRRRLGRSNRHDRGSGTPRAHPLVRDPRQSCRDRHAGSCWRASCIEVVLRPSATGPAADFVAAMAGAAVVPARLNLALASLLARPCGPAASHSDVVRRRHARDRWQQLLALAPLGWLMAVVYVSRSGGPRLLFALPLYTTRMAYAAVRRDARDVHADDRRAGRGRRQARPVSRRKHSHRVKEISVDIGRVMRVSDAELEALEWGGLLHDVGKIGVPDNVLLKQERLNKEERMIMNAHPVLGAQIIAPVTKLAAGAADHPAPPRVVQRLGLPGPPHGRRDPEARPHPPRRRRVRGDDRRPPVPHDAAHAPSRRSASCASSPASSSTRWSSTPSSGPYHVEGVSDPGRTVQPRPIPLIGQVAAQMTASDADRRTGDAGLTGAPATATAAPPPARGPGIDDAVTDASASTCRRADRRRSSSACSSACGPAAASRTSPPSGCAGPACCSSRSSSGSGRRPCSTPGSTSSRRCGCPAPRGGLRPAARRPVGQPRLPGHGPRLRRHPAQRDRHHGQRRLHAGLGADPGRRRA